MTPPPASYRCIISRIRESYDSTGKTDQAVARCIKISAGVVTAAVVITVFVFLSFATMSMVQLNEMGAGLAVAVLRWAAAYRRSATAGQPPRQPVTVA